MSAAEPTRPCGPGCGDFDVCYWNGCRAVLRVEREPLAYRAGYAVGVVLVYLVGAAVLAGGFLLLALVAELLARAVEAVL